MSAAARGAAGYLVASGRRRRRKDAPVLTPHDGEVEALAKQLERLYNVNPERALQLAKEQAAKRLHGRRR